MKRKFVRGGIAVLSIGVLSMIVFSCGVQKIKNLANCEFKLNRVKSVVVAGVALNPTGKTNMGFADLIAISKAYSNKNIPVSVNALLDIKNPNTGLAKMTKMDWKIKLKGKQVAKGQIPDVISVPANSEVTSSLSTGFDLYDSMSEFTLDELKSGVQNAFDSDGNPKDLKIYIKPYMNLGLVQIPYPGFIEITKHFKSE